MMVVSHCFGIWYLIQILIVRYVEGMKIVYGTPYVCLTLAK